jgi:hypothetical protein
VNALVFVEAQKKRITVPVELVIELDGDGEVTVVEVRKI